MKLGIINSAFQQVGIDTTRALIRKGRKRILLVLPTGGGKTIVAAAVIAGTIAKGNRILFVGPRREIICQTFWKLIDAGVPEFDTGVIMGDGWITDRDGAAYSAKRRNAPAQVASVQTLQNRRTWCSGTRHITALQNRTSAFCVITSSAAPSSLD